MNTETNPAKTRVPRNFDSILKGALSLSLKERVDLVNAVTSANQEEVKVLKQQADEATKLLG